MRESHSVAALIALRNGLTHFKPEWENEQEEHAKLSQRLASKFVPSPFRAGSEPLFPKRWALHGCTQWALKSCVDFLNNFESLSGVPPRATKFAARLNG